MNIEQIGAQYSRKLEKKIHWKIQIKISIILSICFTEIQSNLSQGRNRNRSTWNHLNPSSNRVWTRVAWLIERCSFPRILHCNAAKRLSFLFEIGAVHFLWNDFVHLRRPSRISFFSPRNPCASFSPPFHFLLVPTPRSLLGKDPGERRIGRKRDVARAR